MLDHWRTTNVIFDGKLHTFNAGTPQSYRAERAIIQGVASLHDKQGNHVTSKARTITVTRARGEQELRTAAIR